MTLIPVNDELAQLIDGAQAPVVLVNSKGERLGRVTPAKAATLPDDATDEEVVAEIKRRMAADDGTRYSFSDLLQRLHEQFPE